MYVRRINIWELWFGDHTCDTQGFLLALHLGTISGAVQWTIWLAGMEPGTAACKQVPSLLHYHSGTKLTFLNLNFHLHKPYICGQIYVLKK